MFIREHRQNQQYKICTSFLNICLEILMHKQQHRFCLYSVTNLWVYLKSFRRLTNTVQIARCRARYNDNYAWHTHGYCILANVVPINRIDKYDIRNHPIVRYINKNYSKYTMSTFRKYSVIVKISKIKSV